MCCYFNDAYTMRRCSTTYRARIYTAYTSTAVGHNVVIGHRVIALYIVYQNKLLYKLNALTK